jgi:malate dehydrogenase (oxaloacetate-decarboxylating)
LVEEEALIYHKRLKGKIEISTKMTLDSMEALSLAYTPGVALPCLEIAKSEKLAYDYTSKGNTIAIVTDGSAVLGLGNIGSLAAMPVMEGKSMLFKAFGNVNAIPIYLNTQNVEEIIHTIKIISPGFGGINLEDIAAPRCFEIEKALRDSLDIPIFHDDQHGTAIVVLAALYNALTLADKSLETIKIVINGAGAAGIAIARLLLIAGASRIILCDQKGILTRMDSTLKDAQAVIAKETNPLCQEGSLSDALIDADVLIGVSAGNVVSKDMIRSMSKKAIVFAMANPEPEIMPGDAKLAGAFIVGTGRSDFENQINNVLAFPGVFKGVLDARLKEITYPMMISAARAIARCIDKEDLHVGHVIPSPFHPDVHQAVARAMLLDLDKREN